MGEELASDRLVPFGNDGGDDAIDGYVLLAIQPAHGIPGDIQIYLIALLAEMVGDLRYQAEAGTGPDLGDSYILNKFQISVFIRMISKFSVSSVRNCWA